MRQRTTRSPTSTGSGRADTAVDEIAQQPAPPDRSQRIEQDVGEQRVAEPGVRPRRPVEDEEPAFLEALERLYADDLQQEVDGQRFPEGEEVEGGSLVRPHVQEPAGDQLAQSRRSGERARERPDAAARREGSTLDRGGQELAGEQDVAQCAAPHEVLELSVDRPSQRLDDQLVERGAA